MSPMVLLVESDADLRSAISCALQRAEYECDAVASPTAALLKLREHDYAYVLVDDGSAELQDALVEQQGKVILITEDELPDSDTLRKPFDNEQLLSHLR
jgi:DNA-binding response OmpR family regulator